MRLANIRRESGTGSRWAEAAEEEGKWLAAEGAEGDWGERRLRFLPTPTSEIPSASAEGGGKRSRAIDG